MDAYFAERKSFIVAALIAAELFATVMHFPVIAERIQTELMMFWLYSLPLNLTIFGAFAAMFFARSRRANIAALIAQIVVFTIPYWSYQLVTNAVRDAYGYAAT